MRKVLLSLAAAAKRVRGRRRLLPLQLLQPPHQDFCVQLSQLRFCLEDAKLRQQPLPILGVYPIVGAALDLRGDLLVHLLQVRVRFPSKHVLHILRHRRVHPSCACMLGLLFLLGADLHNFRITNNQKAPPEIFILPLAFELDREGRISELKLRRRPDDLLLDDLIRWHPSQELL